MKETLSLFFLLLFVVIFFAYASPFPPNCVCEITAQVITIKESRIRKNEFEDRDFTSVDMDVEIIQVGSMIREGYSPEMTCAQYKVGEKIKVYTIKERDYLDKGAVINSGEIIKANIEYTGDEWGKGYYFDKIRVVDAH